MKTSTSVSISEGDVSQDNEGRSRSHDGESFAAEAVVTPTRNMKPKSQARSIAKRRRWNEFYVKYGFYRSAKEEHNQYPSANCLFCPVKYCYSGTVPLKLELHLKKQHPEHQYKFKKFFELQLSAICKQKRSFELQMMNKESKDVLLALFMMAHVVLKSKRPYTELEAVILPCLKIAADLIHGGKEAVDKVSKISLSDTTVYRRCQSIATDLEDQLIEKLKQAPLFTIQLDETTDVSLEAQLIVFCQFANIASKKITEHYLFCKPLGVDATANAIFEKLDDYLKEKGLSWENCKSVTTDGAAAMTGSINGVVKKIKERSPKCVSIHCILHREALVAKKMKRGDHGKSDTTFVKLLQEVVGIVNFVQSHSKSAGYSLSCVKKWTRHSQNCSCMQKYRIFLLRKEMGAFLTEQHDHRASKFYENYWLAKVAYMASIFEHLNKLNLNLQS